MTSLDCHRLSSDVQLHVSEAVVVSESLGSRYFATRSLDVRATSDAAKLSTSSDFRHSWL